MIEENMQNGVLFETVKSIKKVMQGSHQRKVEVKMEVKEELRNALRAAIDTVKTFEFMAVEAMKTQFSNPRKSDWVEIKFEDGLVIADINDGDCG